MSSPRLLELVVPQSPTSEETKPATTKHMGQSEEPLSLTEEEERELAELMEDDI